MAATQRAKPQVAWSGDVVPQVDLTAAGASHRDVPSPAMLLQSRVGAAFATADSAYGLEPAVDKWPAATRIAILFGAASASWLILWEAVKYLI